MWTPPQRIRHALPDTAWPDADTAANSRLFSPVSVGSCRLEQRTWVPAMVPWRATADGFVSDDVIDWYARFAAGRPGAIVVEATGIRDIASGPLLRIGDDRFVPGLARLCEAVRQSSDGHTRLFIQLIDFLTVRRRVAPTTYFSRFFTLRQEHRTRLAAATDEPRWLTCEATKVLEYLGSADERVIDRVLTEREREDLRVGYRERVTDTHLPHVADLPQCLPDAFARAAARAKTAGFDGVELHYAHAYTMASLLSRTNTRADGFGGDLRGRLRLPIDVVTAVRGRVGKDFVVGCRLLGDEVIDAGTRIDEAAAISIALIRAGLDFISVSKGGKFDDAKQPAIGHAVYPYTGRSGYECMPTIYSDEAGPFGRNVSLAATIRAALRSAGLETPVVTAGGICNFAQAEAILAAGQADIIGAARQSLADPDWWLKMQRGRGTEVRRCKFTNYCEALDTHHKQVTCQRWDRVDLDAPGVARSHDGRRRLVAPPWRDKSGE